MKELFTTTKMFATAKECFTTVKLKSRNIASSGLPRRRLLLAETKVKARRGEEQDYGKATLEFTMANVDGME